MTKLERFLRNEVQRTERQSFDYSTKDQADEAADAREILKEYLEIRASHETWIEHTCPCNCRCCTSGGGCRDDADACRCRGCATNSECLLSPPVHLLSSPILPDRKLT